MSIPKEVEESSSRKLSGLDPGTEYEITAVIEFTLNPDYGTVELSTTASTDDADFGGSLDITATTANSISARLIDMNSDYPKHRMRITWLIAGSEKQSYTFTAGPTKTSAYTYTGLKPNYNYLVEIQIEDTVTGWSDSWSRWVKTSGPTKWNWDQSNGKASASLTQKALKALVNRTSTRDFSYLVWNDLCSKVSEIRQAAGLSAWDTYAYGELDDIKMSGSGEILTASRFNSVRNNLDGVRKSGIRTVYTGDVVKATYFTDLANAINDAIKNL